MMKKRRNTSTAAIKSLQVNQSFFCKDCGILLMGHLVILASSGSMDFTDGANLLPQGRYWVSDGKYAPEVAGDFLVNLKDLQNVQLLGGSGCCGVDGLNGPNIVCLNGHEVGTERSDCWMPHHAVMLVSQIEIRSQE
jgi:hypothetical protein